jgi:uncharacterized membrane protein
MVDRHSTRLTALGSLAIVGVGVAASALAWSSLPAEMAIHWDASGTADGAAPRAVGALLLPVVALAVVGLLLAVPRFDPLGENIATFRGYYNGFVLLLTAYLVGIHGVVLAVNLDYAVPISALVAGAAGLLFVYTGLLLRVAEPNWFVGIRTPWTLSSETVWHRVHEVGGALFVAVGVLTAAAAAVGVAVGIEALGVAVLTAGSLGVALATVGYSYYLYETLDEPGDRPTTN